MIENCSEERSGGAIAIPTTASLTALVYGRDAELVECCTFICCVISCSLLSFHVIIYIHHPPPPLPTTTTTTHNSILQVSGQFCQIRKKGHWNYGVWNYERKSSIFIELRGFHKKSIVVLLRRKSRRRSLIFSNF